MVTSASDTTVDAGAEKRFFIEMLTKDIELLPAIVDLVDNSVDGARGLHPDGDLSGQWVKIEFGDDSFTISDNSGGISVDVARHYAFRFGRSKDFTGVKRSVGQFGVGMKRAIFKIGRAFAVQSAHRGEASADDGSRFSLNVDVEQWAVQQEWTFQFERVEEGVALATDEEAGTVISVTKLHPSVQDDLKDPAIVQALRTELRVRHQESIQSGLQLHLNSDKPLVASRPSLQASDVIQPVFKEFQVPGANGGTVDVKLYAGTVAPRKRDKDSDPEDEGQAENFQDPGDAGWYLFCNDRLLLVADRTSLTGWGNPAAAYHPQYRSFRGFVYLSADDAGLLPWNTTKTAVDRDSPVFRAVQSEMKTVLVAVQAVINRAKQVRARLEDEEPKPDILVALDETPDKPITSLTASSSMVTPPSPPAKPKAPPTPKVQRIQYVVDPDKFEEVAEALGASSGSEVGRLTFDYFYEQEIG
ncbi:histidine kinase/DNA gyrase B/HSP90-like ATPase [Yimella lutea]|uniref:Histidine kinase/DNA gyrase B/HSP90-like ATPase n=1 Tax=Yimella lutea TaxID=587872 RepID=A0A542EH66_9MICO|nr:ATP-binding protein [Yimella lutea]TQJ14680.1 histidine kinase/DNA gyrase B/HSP90-like ATPase [Yimella lutea]